MVNLAGIDLNPINVRHAFSKDPQTSPPQRSRPRACDPGDHLAARLLASWHAPPPLTLGRRHAVVAWPVRNAGDPRVTWIRALIGWAAGDPATPTELG